MNKFFLSLLCCLLLSHFATAQTSSVNAIDSEIQIAAMEKYKIIRDWGKDPTIPGIPMPKPTDADINLPPTFDKSKIIIKGSEIKLDKKDKQ